MADLRPDQLAASAPEADVRRARRAGTLSAARVHGIVGLVALVTAGQLWRTEGDFATAIFTVGVALTMAATIVLVTRRLLCAAVVTPAVLGAIYWAGYTKQRATNVVLHAYDVVAAVQSPAAIVRLARDNQTATVAVAAAVAVTVLAAIAAYRLDRTRVRPRTALAAAVLFAGVAALGALAKGDRQHTEMYFEDIYISTFFASWSETLEVLGRGQLLEAAPRASNEGALRAGASCEPSVKPPHIVLIHQESVAPPGYFPGLSYDRSLDQFFTSLDGRVRQLRVETYGGASWLTEFSLLTGLSTLDFGGMRQLVQPLLAGKIRDTLPQALTRCGYRAVMFYPMLTSFVTTAKFFPAVGLSEIYDAKAQKASTANERDRFYYANAMDEMERHLKASDKPLFTYLQTMSAHGGYGYTYMPQERVSGGGAGTSPEMNEYLRRLAMVRIDYAAFRENLSRRFPGQAFLILHYGDHQPTATRTLLGFGRDASIEEVMRSGNPAALLSYYAIDGVGYRPQELPDLRTVDVPYLGTILLRAAGLPLPDSYRERERLMRMCDGRYHDCVRRDEILKFHRKLIDAGLVVPH